MLDKNIDWNERCTIPLVSVIAPCYNVEKYIDRFIKSVLNQNYTNWELILVDDGSTDETIKIIQRYCASDVRIKLFFRGREPKGADTCRNIGQKKISGKYFMILDSDDEIKEFCILQRVEYMENHPDIDYATFKGVSVTNDGIVMQKWGEKNKRDIISGFLCAQYPFGVWNNIYRSDSLRNHLWDEKLKIYMDFDYLITVALGDFKHDYAELSKPDYCYYIGNANALTTNYVTDEKYKSTKYLFLKVVNLLKQNNLWRKYRNDFQPFFMLQFRRLFLNGDKEKVEDFFSFYMNIFAYKNNILFRIIYKHLYNCMLEKGDIEKKVEILKYVRSLKLYCRAVLSRIINKNKI